jgi:4-amino-4-deoxy-L-arabinose transferase-like glycosyltransferase
MSLSVKVVLQMRQSMALLSLASLITLLNVIKPVHIDDTYYRYFAAQIAERPLDPYGFEMFWWQEPLPARTILAPPVALYWLALGIRLFGEHPWLWKLWLLGFNLLLTYSLYALYRRFARRLEWPLVTMTVLSPFVLPSLNLMLDIPALALSLFAVTIFLTATDRGSARLALVAGLTAGLAMQTKYTALITPLVLLLAAGLNRRQWRCGAIAVSAAVLLFVAWEYWIALSYGESSFLCNLRQQKVSLIARYSSLGSPLLTHMGGLGAGIWLLALAALRKSRWVLGAAIILVVSGYLVLAWAPESYSVLLRSGATGSPRLRLNALVFGVPGALLWSTLAVAAWKLLRLRSTRVQSFLLAAGRRRVEWFLVLWLVVEVAGYFMTSPFPAARRVLGILVVTTLIVGRLAARTCRRQPYRGRLAWLALGGIFVGVGYYLVDLEEARGQQRAAHAAARRSYEMASAAIVWYVGNWGFQYYAEEAGMQPIIQGRSLLRRGEWLVIPDARYRHQRIAFPRKALVREDQLVFAGALPWRTVPAYYGGGSPLEQCAGPQITVSVYRVLRDFIPAKPRPEVQQ